jgi:hypothetical protein
MRLHRRIGILPAEDQQMTNAKKKWVAFKGNSTVPASVLKVEGDVKANAGEPILLPGDYADHVIGLRIAAECAAPKKAPAAKAKTAPKPGPRADAQKAVEAAQSKLDGLAQDSDEYTAAATDLDAAKAALAALKPAN